MNALSQTLKTIFGKSSLSSTHAFPENQEEQVLPYAQEEDGKTEEERLSAWANSLGLGVGRRLADAVDFEERINLPIQYFKRIGIVPLHIKEGTLTVAVNDPSSFTSVDDLVREFGCSSSKMVLSTRKEIDRAIHRLFDQSSEDAERMVQDLEAQPENREVFTELEELEDLMDVSHEAPIIRLVNMILTQALRRQASDIHVEPFEKEIKVRFRIDGILYEVFSLQKRFHAHLVSRLKVMANLDIAEKRVPQDGRLKVKVANKVVDVRVSIIPMSYGERIVLRLLDKTVSLVGLNHMGMTEKELGTFERLINKNSGIILVTGPTGSGKTTTLYAAVNRINSLEKNIITIEDPIEYELKGVGQIQVNLKTDLSFARGLRSVLRHDPDIIMVGEIRDLETVEIAIQASLTGHMVFSTLHTNNAAGALTRLVDMGVESFLIASSLLAVVAQRLVRTICPDCQEAFEPDVGTIEELHLPKGQIFWRGRGCPTCMDSGYKGRTGIFELLTMDNEIRQLLTSGADAVKIRDAAVKAGMTTLFEDGLEKVKSGITTLDEVMRVTQE
jgi:general secretion pathway protein E